MANCLLKRTDFLSYQNISIDRCGIIVEGNVIMINSIKVQS